ncbi:MAG: metal ABC transporter permease [Bacilli bacterium]
MNLIQDLIRYEYLRSAYLVGILFGIIAPIIGVYIVSRRLSVITEAISHNTIGGISFGMYLAKIYSVTISPIIFGVIFAISSSLIVQKIRESYTNYKDVAIPIIMSLGLSLSLIFTSLAGGFNTDFNSLLFGTILTSTMQDVYLLGGILIFILISYKLFYNKIVALSIDENYCKYIGINSKKINYIFIIVIAVIISLGVRIMGALLISSLIVIPVSTALKLSNSYKGVVIISMIISLFSIILGMTLSYYLNIPSGATIVLVNVIVFGLTLLRKGIE